MTDTEVQVFPNTQSALEKDLTLRCIIQTKYGHEMSRRSAVVIPWAQSLAERISSAVVEKASHPTTGFTTQLNLIEMVGLQRNIVYICYDLFLDECEQKSRTDSSGNSHLRRPIHMITRKNKVFIVRRDQRADEEVFREYSRKRDSDKEPLPLFTDLQHPPVYHNGRRLIEWEERTQSQLAWWRQDKEEPEKTSEGNAKDETGKDENQNERENAGKEDHLEADTKQDEFEENNDLRSD